MADLAPELHLDEPARSGDSHLDLRRLDLFAGDWALLGRQLEGPFGPPMDLHGRQTYEWLLGERFMLMRLEGTLGDNEMGCAEIIGEAPNGHGLRAHTFYNDGSVREWKLGEKNGVWIRTGEEETAEGRVMTRFILSFSPDGREHGGKWEYSKDGERWTPFWEVTASRIENRFAQDD